MNHKAVRVDNLMYKGCELHWKCVLCGKCVPKHCYTKEQFEAQECDTKKCYERLREYENTGLTPEVCAEYKKF